MTNPARGRARIGVLVPFTNTNLEPDLAMLCPEGVSIHVARIGGYDADAVPGSEQMTDLGEASLDEPLRLLAGARPGIVLYGCTSATLSHGAHFDKDLAARIRTLSGAETVTAAGALVTALKALNVTRIAFASPYVRELNDRAITFLMQSDIETVSRADVGAELDNHGQGELAPSAVMDLARDADSSGAEAIVLSCTDMRGVETVETLEAELGKPVVTSNQAMVFSAMQILGIADHGISCGQLFRASPPSDVRPQKPGYKISSSASASRSTSSTEL